MALIPPLSNSILNNKVMDRAFAEFMETGEHMSYTGTTAAYIITLCVQQGLEFDLSYHVEKEHSYYMIYRESQPKGGAPNAT